MNRFEILLSTLFKNKSKSVTVNASVKIILEKDHYSSLVKATKNGSIENLNFEVVLSITLIDSIHYNLVISYILYIFIYLLFGPFVQESPGSLQTLVCLKRHHALTMVLGPGSPVCLMYC